jgi:hypothetical protein
MQTQINPEDKVFEILKRICNLMGIPNNSQQNCDSEISVIEEQRN